MIIYFWSPRGHVPPGAPYDYVNVGRTLTYLELGHSSVTTS